MSTHFRTPGRANAVRAPKAAEVFTRRAAFKTVTGVLAAAAAASTVLSGVFPVRAKAAIRQAGLPAVTTVEQGALAPAVVTLTDAQTITVDASLGNDFRVTLGSSRTMGNPVNSSDGQQIIFQVTQGSAGAAGITWSTGYEFSAALPQPALSASPGETDLLGFVYSAAKGKWLLAAFVNGFA